jgi:uncharacterized protein YndB with AHSA1/START domain
VNDKIEARASRRFGATAEQLFDAWLNPAMVRGWLTSALRGMGLPWHVKTIEIDPRVGGQFIFTDERGHVEARHWGTYLELDRPRRIVFTWIVDPKDEADPSRVTLMIEPDDEGCVATLVHEIDARWVEFLSKTESGWNLLLQSAGRLAETRGRGPSPS